MKRGVDEKFYETYQDLDGGGGGDMLNEKRRIVFLIKVFPLLGIIFIALALIIVSIVGINKYFKEEEQKIEKKIKADTIYKTKKDVKSFFGLVSSIDNIVNNSFRREVKIAVELGHTCISQVYKTNKAYPRNIILQKIKDTLRDVRFYDDKSGYYFIYDLKGTALMVPISPDLEGRNLMYYKDIKGKYVIKDIVNIVQTKNQGFLKWYYYKPNTNIISQKMGYVKIFKPLNILIGSAVYEGIVKKEKLKRILQVISRVDTAKLASKVLIIQKTDGKLLYSSDRELINRDLWNYKIGKIYPYRKMITLINKNPNKSIKQFEIKTPTHHQIFIFGYNKNLDMITGEVIDLNYVNKVINNQKDKIQQVVSEVLRNFLFVSLVFVILALFITIYLSQLLETIFDKYESSLIKEKEKAQNAAKVKSEFLANMSHEIRTPLNAMFGFIKILQEKELDDEAYKYLNIIEKSGENLLTIINDILDFSKLESGKFQIEKISFNPKEEIEVIHELFGTKASEKNILLKIEEKGLKYNLISDPTRIKQIIANLLSNAIKFTPEGKTIILKVEYDENREKLFVGVEDNGIGIPKHKQDTIFQAFSQADTSTTRKYGGTGLGLTISYKLVKLLGGELKVDSIVGSGSIFYFIIPAKKGELITDKPEQIHKSITKEEYNYYVLLVEDNKANQMFMKIILKKLGIRFDIANDGIEAIEMFEKNRYDLILMDENMPNMNGIEATKKIRQIEREQNLDETIIVALTANALEGDKDRFILAGMNYYLSKPLDIEKLKEIFEKLRERK